jgi:hypothetical protein
MFCGELICINERAVLCNLQFYYTELFLKEIEYDIAVSFLYAQPSNAKYSFYFIPSML